jgi:broad specificity phosphatase PhoE
MYLTLVRHGPTEWNALDRFQGRSDIPLSPAGRGHARAIAAALREEPIDRIYSSDLVRALETARIIAEARSVQIVTDARLREFDFGRWEGLTWDEIVSMYPVLRGRAPTTARLHAPEAGETFEQVFRRVKSFLDDLQAHESEVRVVTVTHAGPLHAFLAAFGFTRPGAAAADFDRFSPGSITRIATAGGRARLVALNAVEHLKAAR